MKNKKILLTLFAIFQIILVTLNVSSFGVSSPYWEGFPLTMARGETQIVKLNLQNVVGDEDVRVRANLAEGGDIASLRGTDFTVEAGTADIIAPLEIRIPQDFQPGDTKKIKVEFKTVSEGQGGAVSLGTGFTVSFDVIVSEEEIQFSPLYEQPLMIIPLVLLIAIVVVLVLMRRKKKMLESQKRLTNFK